MISTVVFDADETLIDLPPAVQGALSTVLEEMQRLSPAAAALSLADLAAEWAVVWAQMPSAPVAEIRRAALARALTRVDLDDHLDRITELFFARRFALTRPYADALDTITTLAASYQLGFATNGNSRADRCGLGGRFAFEVYAHTEGLPKKPSPAFYAAVVAAAGVEPERIVYVGDNLDHDVVAAQAAGLRAVWVNRNGRALPADVAPDAEIRQLADLPAALVHLASRPASPRLPASPPRAPASPPRVALDRLAVNESGDSKARRGPAFLEDESITRANRLP